MHPKFVPVALPVPPHSLPSGEGGIVAGRPANRRSLEHSSTVRGDSLSPEERAGVRGKATSNHLLAIILVLWLKQFISVPFVKNDWTGARRYNQTNLTSFLRIVAQETEH